MPTVVSSFTDGDHIRVHTAKSRCVKEERTEGLQQGGRVGKVRREMGLHEFCCHKKKNPTDVQVPEERHLAPLSLSLSLSNFSSSM